MFSVVVVAVVIVLQNTTLEIHPHERILEEIS